MDQGRSTAFLTYLHLLTTLSPAKNVNNQISSWQSISDRFYATFLVKFNSNVDLINRMLVSGPHRPLKSDEYISSPGRNKPVQLNEIAGVAVHLDQLDTLIL